MSCFELKTAKQSTRPIKSQLAISTIANVYHEFREGPSVAVSGIPLSSATDVWSGEFGLGTSFTSGDGVYAIHGNASVSSALEDFANSCAVKGAAGVTISF